MAIENINEPLPDFSNAGTVPNITPTEAEVAAINPMQLGSELGSTVTGAQQLANISKSIINQRPSSTFIPNLNNYSLNELPTTPIDNTQRGQTGLNFQLPDINQTLNLSGKVIPSESAALMPQIESSIRGAEDSRRGEISYLDSASLNNAVFGGIGDQRLQTTRYNVDPKEIYTTLNNGTEIATVSNYIGGTNNQDRLARQQSSASKIGNGLLRFAGKTLVNVAGGTAGIVSGIVSLIEEGRFSAVYDNNFGRTLDDLNTRMDYQLPIYKTQDEQQMGFVRRLGTTSFWADEFLNGLSFLSGALLTEAAWAGLTFGTSTATTAGRLATRFGARAGSRAAIQEAGQTLNALQRATYANKAFNVANTLRFTLTSAGYESSVEARHSFKEALEDYITNFENAYGRQPNEQEVQQFTDTALQNSNFVFGANMAIVGSSNLYQLGSYFGLKAGLSESIQNAIGRKVFGRKVIETVAEDGSKILKAVRGNRVQRGLETSFNILKRPFVEGVYEEGLQGAISETSKSWLNSRFDPNATEYNISVISAFLNGLEESYGTREGRLEIGVGALIGLVGSAGQRGADGRNILLGTREASSLYNYLNTQVSNRNTSNAGLKNSLENTILRLHRANQSLAAFNEAEASTDVVESAIALDTANFTQMLMQDEIGYFTDSETNFNQILDNITPQAIREMDSSLQNLSDSQLQAYKEAIRNQYNQDIADYRSALEIAQAINPTAQYTDDGQVRNYTGALALNIYQGKKAYNRLNELSELIDETLGAGQSGDILAAWSLVSEERQALTEQLQNLNQTRDEYEQRLVSLQQNLSQILTSTQTEVDTELSGQRVQQEDTVRQQVVELTKQLTEVESQIQTLTSQIGSATEVDSVFYNRFLGVNVKELTVDELLQLNEYNQEIRQIVNAMRRNPNVSDATVQETDLLLREFQRNSQALKSFIQTANRMSDPRFLESTEGGSLLGTGSLLRAGLSNVARTNYKGQEFTEETQRVLDGIDMSDDAKFTLGTLLDTFAGVNAIEQDSQLSLNTPEVFNTNLREVEPISDEVWNANEGAPASDAVVESILRKRLSGIPLSPREQSIYRNNRNIRERERQARLTEGKSLPPVIPENETKTDRLRRLVLEAIEASPTLQEQNNINEIPNKPTEAEIDEYITLLGETQKDTYRRPALTENQQRNVDRFLELADQIRKYGNFSGVTIGDGISILDALTLLQQFEINQTGATTAVITSQDTTTMLEELPLLNSESRNEKNMFAQVWDKVTMSFVSNVETLPFATIETGVVIQGLTVAGLLGHFNNIQSVVKHNPDTSVEDVNLEDGLTVNPGDNLIVEFTNGQKMIISIDARSNPILDLSQQQIIEENSDLILSYLGNLAGSYKVLLSQGLTPVDSDYQLDSGKEINLQAVKELNPNDELKARVDLDNPYNRALISTYNNSNKSAEDLTKLRNGLVIEIYDTQNRLVGVFKAAHNDAMGTSSYQELINVRNSALEKIIGNIEGSQVEGPRVDRSVMNQATSRLPILEGNTDKILGIDFANPLIDVVTSPIIEPLIEPIRRVANSLGVTIQFSTTTDSSTEQRPGYFNSQTGEIVIQLPYLFRAYDISQIEGVQMTLEEYLGQTILHEMLHSVTAKVYQEVANNSRNGRYFGNRINQTQANAMRSIFGIYNYLKSQVNSAFPSEPYGLSSIYEFMAELGNSQFVSQIQGIEIPENLRYRASESTSIFENVVNYLKDVITGQRNSSSTTDSLFNALSDILSAGQDFEFNNPQVYNPTQQTTTSQATNVPNVTSGLIDVDVELSVDDTLPGRPNLNISDGDIIFTPLDAEARKQVIDVGYIYNGKLRLKNSTSEVNLFPFTSHVTNNKDGLYTNKYVPVVILEAGGKRYAYPARYQTISIDIVPQLYDIIDSDLTNAEKLLRLNTVLSDNGLSYNEFGFTPADLNDESFSQIVDSLQGREIAENISVMVRSEETSREEILNRISLDIDLNNNPFHSPKFKVRPTVPTNTNVGPEGVKLNDGTINEVESELNKPC